MFARNRQKHAEETANKHQRNVQETHLTTSRTIRAKVASFAKEESESESVSERKRERESTALGNLKMHSGVGAT